MISFQVLKGSDVSAVAKYCEGNTNDNANVITSTGEYYNRDSGGKLFITASKEMQEYLEKQNANTTEDMLASLRGKSRIGLDMTVSFNKDVSVLALLYDKKAHDIIRDEIAKLMQKVNDEYIQTREYVIDSEGNKQRVFTKASALIQTFEHHTSRDLDIDLHYHNVISNQVIRKSDNALTSLSAEKLIENAHKIRIEHYYQIAYRLQSELKVDAYLNSNGDLRVLDDDNLINAFSKRKQAIIELAKQRYNTDDLSSLSREQVKDLVMATRQTKKHENIETLKDAWLDELEQLGYTEESFIKAITHSRTNTLSREDVEKAFDIALKIYDESEGIFLKDHLYREYLIRLSDVAKEQRATLISLDKAQKLFEELIREKQLIQEMDERGKEYVATREYINVEQTTLTIATSMMKEKPLAFFEVLDLERHKKEFERDMGFQLSGDQKAELEKLVNSKLTIVNGHAGAGKTTVLEILKRASDEVNISIIGLTPSGKAGEELSKAVGVGQTIDSFLLATEKMTDQEFKEKYVNKIFIIDEVGMVDNRKLHQLLTRLNKVDCKIIMQGDYKQIKAVQAGDFLKDISFYVKQDEEVAKSYAELTSIRRQKIQEYRDITTALSEKNFEKAFDILITNEDKYFAKFDTELLKKDFLADRNNAIIVASTNNLKDELNSQIRDELIKSKALSNSKKIKVENTHNVRSIDDIAVNDVIYVDNKHLKVINVDRKTNTITFEYETYNRQTRKREKHTAEKQLSELINKQIKREREIELAVNDRVMTTRNSKDVNVKNGELWVVKDIKGNKITLENENKKVVIDVNEYKNIDYSYAITAHKSQGMTVKTVLVADATQNMNSNLFYVALTRGKENLKIYTNDIVNTLNTAQREQIKQTSTRLHHHNQKNDNEKRIKRDDLIVKYVSNAKTDEEKYQRLKQYSKYIDDYKDVIKRTELESYIKKQKEQAQTQEQPKTRQQPQQTQTHTQTKTHQATKQTQPTNINKYVKNKEQTQPQQQRVEQSKERELKQQQRKEAQAQEQKQAPANANTTIPTPPSPFRLSPAPAPELKPSIEWQIKYLENLEQLKKEQENLKKYRPHKVYDKEVENMKELYKQLEEQERKEQEEREQREKEKQNRLKALLERMKRDEKKEQEEREKQENNKKNKLRELLEKMKKDEKKEQEEKEKQEQMKRQQEQEQEQEQQEREREREQQKQRQRQRGMWLER